jgi:hypothetical protein
MKIKGGLLLIALCSVCICFSQQPDTLIKKLDSLYQKADSAGGQKNNIQQEAYNTNSKISFKEYFILLGSDFKQQFTAPFKMNRDDYWKLASLPALQ